jgi:hypothetical protein
MKSPVASLLGAVALSSSIWLGCQSMDTPPSQTESHQTQTVVHEHSQAQTESMTEEEESGTGGAGPVEAGCSHDPDAERPCKDAFFDAMNQK